MARVDDLAYRPSLTLAGHAEKLSSLSMSVEGYRPLNLDYSDEANNVDILVTANRTGFSGSVSGYVSGAGSFADITDLAILMTRQSDFASVRAAATEGHAHLLLDAGEGQDDQDWLTIDLSGVRNAVFQENSPESVISNYGSFLGFERYDVALGRGTNIVRTGVGDDHIRSVGVDTVDGGDGTDRWSGDYSTSRAGLIFRMNETSGTLSNGTALTNIECYDLRTGGGNDLFDIVNPRSEDGQAVNGGAGYDTLRADLALSAPDTGAFSIYSEGERGYHGTLGGDWVDLGFRDIEALGIIYGAADDRGIVSTGAISRAGGSLSIDGGDGFDILTIPMPADGYELRSDGRGGFIVNDIDRGNGDNGWFALRNFESLAFSDRTVDLDLLAAGFGDPVVDAWAMATAPHLESADLLL